MAKLDQIQNENISKGNSEDSLLVIYILRILKKYSSPQNPLSSQDVMNHLREDYSIGSFEKSEAQRKKVRRHLDTLHESFWNGCIKKVEGKTRNSHKWYYDISRDNFAKEEGVVHETLSEVEIDLLIDLISATKILNSEGTRGIVDKLLKKTSISNEDRERRLALIQKEEWLKTPNSDLVKKKNLIEECFDNCCLTFYYEDEETITATPIDWYYDDGICFLNAKVGNEYRKFSLDKIRILDSDVDGFEDLEDFRFYNEETDSDKTTLDSLIVNIPTIKSAIANKKCIHFLYCSYAVSNDRVITTYEEKSVLPHSLVFNDGKYYLIGIDENSSELDKIVYFRVDLMFELYYAKTKIEISNWDKYVFATIERARMVEKHPLMLAGEEVSVTFNVVESALDRVIEAFAIKPDEFHVTNKTRPIKDSSDGAFRAERVVSVKVRTTKEEAFRWALANANVVELVHPQDIRDKIARLSESIYRLYTRSISDKVRENIDYVLKEGTFKISYKVDADTAYTTYKELAKTGNLGVVDNIGIAGEDICDGVDYFGDFINAKSLKIFAPQIKNIDWAARLVNVETLELTSSKIDDASWMKEMKKIRQLYLADSSFSDLSVLREHKEIYELDINGTNICDISFIENFSKLTQLSISTCPIKDYSPLFTTQSRLKYLEIDKKSLEKIGEENIRNRHIGITIKITNNSPFWYL